MIVGFPGLLFCFKHELYRSPNCMHFSLKSQLNLNVLFIMRSKIFRVFFTKYGHDSHLGHVTSRTDSTNPFDHQKESPYEIGSSFDPVVSGVNV